jgi:carbonic anhydrase
MAESQLPAAEALTKARRDAMSPGEVVQAMLDGNRRFLAGERRERDFLAEMRATATGQNPAACVLSCVDSRAAVEVICDLGLGDTFNARVAGNVVNDDILGSAEFACALSGAKLVVVMGHTACGAIKGAIDGAVLGNLTLLLARIREAVETTSYTGERAAANPEFVDAVAETNVKLAVATIRARSPVLAGLEQQGRIAVIGAMYDLASGEIRVIDAPA